MTSESSTLAIMQPYVFPYIGYFQLMHAADRFVFYDDVQFVRRSWISRNRILVDGQAAFFTIPVRHDGARGLICDTRIDPQQHDRTWHKLSKTLSHEYARAPFFAPIFDLIESVLAPRAETIAELAIRSVRATAALLGLDDGRESFRSSERHGNRELCGQDRILDICSRENATRYANLPGGRELYRPEDFESRGIELRFVDGADLRYDQLRAEFVPALSILDVLMFNGADATRRLVERYALSPR